MYPLSITFLLTLTCLWGVQHRSVVADSVLVHGSRLEKKVALTFDACSPYRQSGYDKKIVQTLIETKTAATFLLGGKWVLAHPKETIYLASIPYFELGNHTYSHKHLTSTSEDTVRLEIMKTQEILRKIVGKPAVLFRPPFGEEDERVVRIVTEMGLRTVLYDLASGDPDTTFTKEKLESYVVRSIRNGSIIVMHVNGRGWHSAEALPAIIARLREKGFAFVKVSEMD